MKGNKKIDPRTGLGLIVAANLIAFMQDNIQLEISWIVVLGIIMVLCGEWKRAIKWYLGFGLMLVLQWHILPNSPKLIATSFSIFVNYSRRLYPCLMIGSFMIHTISLREMIVGMRMLRIPQKLIIPISITMRYFPAIREESGHISDAMKLRKIKGIQRAEAFIVPLLMSATTTAEELSAAAVTRGVENPAPKTSLVKLKMGIVDSIALVMAIVFIGLSICL